MPTGPAARRAIPAAAAKILVLAFRPCRPLTNCASSFRRVGDLLPGLPREPEVQEEPHNGLKASFIDIDLVGVEDVREGEDDSLTDGFGKVPPMGQCGDTPFAQLSEFGWKLSAFGLHKQFLDEVVLQDCQGVLVALPNLGVVDLVGHVVAVLEGEECGGGTVIEP